MDITTHRDSTSSLSHSSSACTPAQPGHTIPSSRFNLMARVPGKAGRHSALAGHLLGVTAITLGAGLQLALMFSL